jgi:hypothetical protein
MDDAPSNTIGLAKRILVVVLKGIAGIAAIVAIFCPLGSFTQIFFFAASAAVALICYVALTNLDATHVDEYGGMAIGRNRLIGTRPLKPTLRLMTVLRELRFDCRDRPPRPLT